ncbi:uracil-xanthine permease family protein [Halomarina salina]|uniref:Uracil-xanthine permease family protein n=1 Tax=Halomarina salina TaxID=1872699 RepID=A0ABD5RIS1_9EURY|nr:solute carrier family 23 protein [Halomarina salina]
MSGADSSDGERPSGDADERAGGHADDSLVTYGIEDKPPLPTALLLGGQHYLTMVGANIAVPLILAGVLGFADRPAILGKFVGTFFVVSGVATLAQTTLGNRYPIVQGAPFSLLTPAIAVVGAAPVVGGLPDWQSKLLFLQGAIVAAALAEVAIGYLGVVGRLRRYLSPLVVAPVIALIGLSLFSAPQIVDVSSTVEGAQQNWWLLLLTLGLIVLFSQYLGDRHRTFDLFPVLLGVLGAWVVAGLLSATGFYTPSSLGYVDLAAVTEGQLVYAIHPLQYGVPRFETSFAIGMFAGVIASIVESFADYHAVARLSGVGAPNEQRINNGIGMEGLMTAFAGLMGACGCTSYSENVGAIGITGVASRFVVQVGAVVMLVVGFFGPFGRLVATIPDPIVGGLFVAMFGQIVAVGLSNLKYVDLDSSRNLFVLGTAIFVGLAIPEYMAIAGRDAFVAGLAGVPMVGDVLATSAVGGTLFVVGSTGMAVGGIVALFFDNTIPGTPEERGITAWEALAEGEDDFRSPLDRLRDRGGDSTTRAD